MKEFKGWGSVLEDPPLGIASQSLSTALRPRQVDITEGISSDLEQIEESYEKDDGVGHCANAGNNRQCGMERAHELFAD